MKVKAIVRFYDLKEKKQREIDDLFDATSDRANHLIKLNFVKKIEVKKTK